MGMSAMRNTLARRGLKGKHIALQNGDALIVVCEHSRCHEPAHSGADDDRMRSWILHRALSSRWPSRDLRPRSGDLEKVLQHCAIKICYERNSTRSPTKRRSCPEFTCLRGAMSARRPYSPGRVEQPAYYWVARDPCEVAGIPRSRRGA